MKKIIGISSISVVLGLCLLAFMLAKDIRYYAIAHAQDGTRTTPYTIEMNLYDVHDGKETLQYPTVYAQTSEGMRSRLSYAGGSISLGEVVRNISLSFA